MLQKGIFSYELVNDCKKFIETSLPKKEDSCSHLNTEDITDASYMCTKQICQDFEKKKKKKVIYWFVYSKQYIIVTWSIWEL